MRHFALRTVAAAASVTLAAMLLPAVPAHAQLLFDFTGGFATTSGDDEITAGFTFSVGNEINPTFDSIGFWDEGSDGLLDPHQVGLFTSDGMPLRSGVVDNGATPLVSTETGGRWLFVPIPEITLTEGEYVLLATLEAGTDRDNIRIDVPEANVLFFPGSTIGNPVGEAGGPDLFFTSNPLGSGEGVFGPNLAFLGNAAATPEPSSFALLALLGAGVLVRRHKK